MADSVSVTSHNSYGSRVGNSLKGILGGILLVIISIILLVWNENNYIKQKAALDEGASLVQEASAAQLDSSLEGKEVHLYGQTASDAEALQDNVFGIVTDDLKLKRTVEMYQWYEESEENCTDNLGGSQDCTTTYTYNKKWTDEVINSDYFYEKAGHSNPSNWTYESTEQSKSPITLGAYTLSTIFVNKLDNYSNINLNEQNVKNPNIQNEINPVQPEGTGDAVENNNDSYLYGDSTEDNLFHIQNNYIYIGEDPNTPAVGDLKISFSSVKPSTISIVGKQVGNELTNYTTSNGRGIALLEQGNVTADDMFLHAQKENKMMTRIIRFFGLLLMFCGFSSMLKFVETIAKVVPFVSRIIGVGTGLIALGSTLVVGFITIGLAWIVVRPIVGICCLVIAIGGIFLLRKGKKDKPESSPQPQQSETDTPEPTEVIEA